MFKNSGSADIYVSVFNHEYIYSVYMLRWASIIMSV
jgi:hypothetical protein